VNGPTLRDRHPWLVLAGELALTVGLGLAFGGAVWLAWASSLG
jgi:hypothetical protein